MKGALENGAIRVETCRSIYEHNFATRTFNTEVFNVNKTHFSLRSAVLYAALSLTMNV
jgi:hypothetical protein